MEEAENLLEEEVVETRTPFASALPLLFLEMFPQPAALPAFDDFLELTTRAAERVAEARVEAARAAAAMAPADGAKEVVEAVTRVVRLARAAGRAAPAARAARVVAKVAEASKVALAEMVLDRVVVEAKVPATQPTAEMVGLESWLSPMQLLGGKLRPACASFPCVVLFVLNFRGVSHLASRAVPGVHARHIWEVS